MRTNRPAQVVWAERKRERLIHRQGLGTSSIVFEDYWNPDRKQVLKRMREEYEETVARFGIELPEHLARNAHELRRRQATGGRRGAESAGVWGVTHRSVCFHGVRTLQKQTER